jgi:hypothetical protein
MENRRNFLKLFSSTTAAAASVATIGVLPEKSMRLRSRPRAGGRVHRFPGDGGGVHVRDHMVYDRVRFPKGMELPAYWPFFCHPIGHCEPGTFRVRTFADTNLERGNQFPPPSSMLVERLLLTFEPGADQEDIKTVVERYFFEFRVSNKVMARGSVSLSASVGSLDSLVEPDLKHRGKRLPVSLVESECCVHLTPVYIHALEQFSFDLHATEAPPYVLRKDLALSACLDGQYAFGIQ